MKPILVIADDLTGAAEIGGIGVQCGLKAAIVSADLCNPVSADLLVINTDSRHLPPSDAALLMSRILKPIDAADFGWIYKKTDSILRGPVAAEIDAILKALNLPKATLAPQNPTLNRLIRNRQFIVDSVPLHQTDFANDPEHPRHSSDVYDLLGKQAGNVHVASAESVEELSAIARQIHSGTLPAGGADFFAAILGVRGFQRDAAFAAADQSRDRLFICGSASAASRAAIQRARTIGMAISSMPLAVFHSDSVHEPATISWAKEIAALLQRVGEAIVCVDHPPVPSRAQEIRMSLAIVTSMVLGLCRPKTLWIEGGATAAAIVEHMSWKHLRAVGTLAPGVVELSARDEPEQRLILKPGSYAWPAGAF